MNQAVPTTSAVMPVRLRQDMPRDVATTYWTGEHAAIVKRLPHLIEYTQHHFSPADHGYWPATDRVGTVTPASWRFDGVAETRFTSLVGSVRLLPRIKEVWYDEHNVFEQVLGNLTGPRGGRWWTPGFDASVGHRTVLFLRRRSGVSGRSFRTFVRDRFAPTILQAGARDLRAYTFVPYSSLNYPTPGVSHDNPRTAATTASWSSAPTPGPTWTRSSVRRRSPPSPRSSTRPSQPFTPTASREASRLLA